jgi:hypothetical protein
MQAEYPEVVSSEIAKIRVPTVSRNPEGNTGAREDASAQPAPRSRRPQACMETSRTRTERPGCHPQPQGGGSVGESDEP